MEIVIVSPESRHRDTLISMLESIVLPSSIKLVEVCSDVVKIVNPSDQTIVFIDYREQEKYIEKEIFNLIMNDVADYVVLLVSRNAPGSHFTHFSSCDLIYDEISIKMLKNLLKTVQLKTNL
jgi:hypothetical protein